MRHLITFCALLLVTSADALAQAPSDIALTVKASSLRPSLGATYHVSERVHLRGLVGFEVTVAGDPFGSGASGVFDISMLIHREVEPGLSVYVGPSLTVGATTRGARGGLIGVVSGVRAFVHDRVAVFGEGSVRVSVGSPVSIGLYGSGVGLLFYLGGE